MDLEELLGIRTNINVLKKIGLPEILKISENIYISIQKCELRGNKFIDVMLNNKGEEKFLGRFINENNRVCVKYNNGKILIYFDKFVDGKMQVEKIYSLYDVLDDTFYSLTELEALNLFDEKRDATYLKNKNNLTVRSDLEKIKRIKC